MKKPRVCVVIPAYNEGSVIAEVVKSAKEHFSKSGLSISIVVVDDGSSDSTAKKAHRAGAVVISHLINSGAGAATATGLHYAKKNNFDIAATMDADGQHSPKDVMTGINKMISGSTDLLIGSRLIDSSGMSSLKVIGNKGLGLITFLVFGVKSTDTQSGLRIFSKKAVDTLTWDAPGYEFCSEMLWRAKQRKLVTSEYGIKAIYTGYSKQKGQNNWNGINIVKSLIKRRVVEFFG